jgi:hypothetical protein
MFPDVYQAITVSRGPTAGTGMAFATEAYLHLVVDARGNCHLAIYRLF